MAKNPIRVCELAMPAVVALVLFASALPSANARAASEGPEARALPSAANVEVDTYRVEMTTAGPYKSGAAGSVKITLTAKAGFHINGQYPYRFKASASAPAEGVSYPKPVLERADGQFDEKSAVFSLPFVVGHAGKFAVGGVLNLSVCSPASCIVQKAPLDVTITVQ
jgi:hypothetical protein